MQTESDIWKTRTFPNTQFRDVTGGGGGGGRGGEEMVVLYDNGDITQHTSVINRRSPTSVLLHDY